LTQSVARAVMAVGKTFVIAAGLIDLSVGQLLGLITIVIADLMDGSSALLLPAVAVALLIGAGVAAINGLLVERLGVHPLILTFAMMSVIQAAIFLYTDRSIGAVAPELLWLAGGAPLGIPASLLAVVPVALAAHLLLQRTRFGWHLQAIGASEESARRAGIATGRLKVAAF